MSSKNIKDDRQGNKVGEQRDSQAFKVIRVLNTLVYKMSFINSHRLSINWYERVRK
jgi:hypothetical protein